MLRRVRELIVWTIFSSLATFLASIVLPILGGILVSMYCAVLTCFNRNPSFLLVVMISLATSLASGIAFYWMTSYHLFSGILIGTICLVTFWRMYSYALRYPRIV